jgi:nitroreductase
VKEKNMNEIIKCIHTRRSVKKYTSEMPSEELINAVIKAGTEAASGRNLQAAIIVAVIDKDVRDRLAKVNAEIMGAEGDPFYGAPVVLVVLADKSIRTHVYDGSLVMGNLMLAAHSLGLGSCWIHRARETFERPEWKEWLRSIGVEGEYEGIGNCVIGYLDGEYPAEKPVKDGRVFFVK